MTGILIFNLYLFTQFESFFQSYHSREDSEVIQGARIDIVCMLTYSKREHSLWYVQCRIKGLSYPRPNFSRPYVPQKKRQLYYYHQHFRKNFRPGKFAVPGHGLSGLVGNPPVGMFRCPNRKHYELASNLEQKRKN